MARSQNCSLLFSQIAASKISSGGNSEYHDIKIARGREDLSATRPNINGSTENMTEMMSEITD
jgi:hypothetical protein